jgi:hypothetical protein
MTGIIAPYGTFQLKFENTQATGCVANIDLTSIIITSGFEKYSGGMKYARIMQPLLNKCAKPLNWHLEDTTPERSHPLSVT